MAVPKPIIYFPSLIVKVTLSIYFSITTISKQINLYSIKYIVEIGLIKVF